MSNLVFDLERIRSKIEFDVLDLHSLTRMYVQSPSVTIDILPKPEIRPHYLGSMFTSYMLVSPYRLPQGVDSEALGNLLEQFNYLQMLGYIDDDPVSLSDYGLDNPTRLILETDEGSFNLLVGKAIGGGDFYAQKEGTPSVFSVAGVEHIIDIKPFTLIDKFALILNIDTIEHISITGGPRYLRADLEGKDDDVRFFLNGRRTDTKTFRTWYQSVIGLLKDAEYPGPARNPDSSGGEITIEYRLNTSPGERASITLVPYDRNFYALLQEGTMEFLISRNQIRRIFDLADTMVYDD